MATRAGIILIGSQQLRATYVHWDGDELMPLLKAIPETQIKFLMKNYWSSLHFVNNEVAYIPSPSPQQGFWCLVNDNTNDNTSWLTLVCEGLANLPGNIEYLYVKDTGEWRKFAVTFEESSENQPLCEWATLTEDKEGAEPIKTKLAFYL